MSARPDLRARLALVAGRLLDGYVVDPDDPTTRFVVEILADGLPIALLHAESFDESLAGEGIGDGCYGFAFTLPDEVLRGASLVSARLANRGDRVGPSIDLRGRPRGRDRAAFGHVTWRGGLTIEGRLPIGEEGVATVRALIDGALVAETQARDWVEVCSAGAHDAARAFRLTLPRSMADGRVRRVEVVSDGGARFQGSPCSVVAFEDGLAQFLNRNAELGGEAARAAHFERLLPQSVAFSDWPLWRDRWHTPLCTGRADANANAGATILMIGTGDIDLSLASLRAQQDAQWAAAALPARSGRHDFHPGDAAAVLADDAQALNFVVFMPAGTRLAPRALVQFATSLNAFPAVAAVYADHAVHVAGQDWPQLLPAFDAVRCREQGYCTEVFAMRRDAVARALDAGRDTPGDVFAHHLGTSKTEEAAPVHCPLVLATLPVGHSGLPSRHSTSVRSAGASSSGSASVIVWVGHDISGVERRLEALRDGLPPDRCSVVLVTEQDGDVSDLVSLRDARVIAGVPRLGRARALNAAVADCGASEFILLLDGDVEPADPGWFEILLDCLVDPEIGAAAPLLVGSSGIIRHAGYVLGPGFAAVPAGTDRMVGEPGYGGLLAVARECSAVSAKALLVRRQAFLDVGGFDEHRFAVQYGDVDFCLKLRARGWRLVLTPHARLTQSSGEPDRHWAELDAIRERDLLHLRDRWGEALMTDPYYHPGLNLDGRPHGGLAWPPRPLTPRQNLRPAALLVPPGF